MCDLSFPWLFLVSWPPLRALTIVKLEVTFCRLICVQNSTAQYKFHDYATLQKLLIEWMFIYRVVCDNHQIIFLSNIRQQIHYRILVGKSCFRCNKIVCNLLDLANVINYWERVFFSCLHLDSQLKYTCL